MMLERIKEIVSENLGVKDIITDLAGAYMIKFKRFIDDLRHALYGKFKHSLTIHLHIVLLIRHIFRTLTAALGTNKTK